MSDLAKPFLKEMSLPAITKHLQVLEKAGLITKTRERNGARANSMATDSRTWRIGWNSIERFGKKVLTGWMNI